MKDWPWKKSDPDELVALDRGTKQTKCLRLRCGHDTADISFAAILPTEELSADWVKAHGLADLSVAAPFSCDSLMIQEVELPPMPAADIPDAIRWHLGGTAGEAMEDYIVRYSSVDPDDSKQSDRLRLVAYVAKKEELAEITAFLKRLQLRPHLLEPTAVSLVGAWGFLEERRFDGALLFLDLGIKGTRFVVAYKRRLLQVRQLDPLPQLSKEEDSQPYYQWAVSIQNAMDAYSVHFKEYPIERIYLVGGGAMDSKVPEYLSQNLGLAASPLSFAPRVNFPKEAAALPPFLFAGALGVARWSADEEQP